MVLSRLAPPERTALLRGMSDEEAATSLAAMSVNTRTAVIADLAAADASLVACALACVWWVLLFSSFRTKHIECLFPYCAQFFSRY